MKKNKKKVCVPHSVCESVEKKIHFHFQKETFVSSKALSWYLPTVAH